MTTKSIKVETFDVFDTVLTRKVAHPTDLFVLVGEQLASGFLWRGTGLEWRDLRVQAEQQCRRDIRPEVSFREIHQRLERLTGVPSDSSMDAELRAETDCLYPVTSALRLVTRAREQGRSVAFLSDMYLPSDFLCSILQRFGLFLPGDKVFVSCEHHASKADGKLFKIVEADYAVTPDYIHHTGDHPRSDSIQPRLAGWHSALNRSGALTHAEQQVRRCLPGFGVPEKISARLAGAMREARLAICATHEREQVVREFGASAAAPAILCCLHAIEKWSHDGGLERWFPLARDGEVILHAAQKLGWADRRLPPMTYLHVSRLSLRRAMADLTPEKVGMWACDPTSNPTPRATLARVGLQPDEVAADLCAFGYPAERWDRPFGRLELRRFRAFFSRGEVPRQLATKAAGQRDLAVRYLASKGLTARTRRSAIFDIGWNGSCHHHLLHLLKAEDDNTELSGGYFGLIKKPHLPAGVRAWSALQGGNRDHVRFLHDIVFVLLSELCFSAPHGGVRGYVEIAGGVEPDLGEGFGPAEESWGWNHFRDATLEALPVLNAAVEESGADLNALSAWAALCIMSIKREPTPAQAAFIGDWPACSDSLHFGQGTLAPEFDWAGVYDYFAHNKPQILVWHEAVEQRLSPARRQAFRALWNAREVPRWLAKNLFWLQGLLMDATKA